MHPRALVLPVGVLAGVLAVASPAGAATLTFDDLGLSDNAPITQEYGDRLAETPNVMVDYSSIGGTYRFWGPGYGALSGVAWAENTGAAVDTAEIILTADPGYLVTLGSFDMAGFENDQDLDSVEVVADGVMAWSAGAGPITIEGQPGERMTFPPGPVSGQTVTIRYTDSDPDPISIDYVGIDNITFTQSLVPEPASLGLLGIGGLALLARRRGVWNR